VEKIFDNPSKLEALVKERYAFPPFIMMENAALSLKELIEKLAEKYSEAKCLILCGKGNNGGDGYALARLLPKKITPLLFSYEEVKAPEAKVQYEICRKMGLTFINKKKLFTLLESDSFNEPFFIVDCLFGTGFKGELAAEAKEIIDRANQAQAIRIACDISSGLAFKADYTLTMGELKTDLYSDKAKAVNGKLLLAKLGIDRELFEKEGKAWAYLITKDDCKLPLRNKAASHKGNYGHTYVFAGRKSGAAILCASAAMNFGSGLTSLLETESSRLEQFKISPELMIAKKISRASCLVFGPGMDSISEKDLARLLDCFNSEKTKNPALVFDAGVFGDSRFPSLLAQLDQKDDARLVLTPHLLELTRLCQQIKGMPKVTVEELASSAQVKIMLGKKFNRLFPKTVLVMKSANTFIAAGGQTYIVADGVPSLAKAGSGDLLAGMIAALLAQGYSAKDAAITACQAHALAAKKIGASSYSLTPMKLLKAIPTL